MQESRRATVVAPRRLLAVALAETVREVQIQMYLRDTT